MSVVHASKPANGLSTTAPEVVLLSSPTKLAAGTTTDKLASVQANDSISADDIAAVANKAAGIVKVNPSPTPKVEPQPEACMVPEAKEAEKEAEQPTNGKNKPEAKEATNGKSTKPEDTVAAKVEQTAEGDDVVKPIAQAAPAKAAPTSPQVKEESQPAKEVDKSASGGSVTAQAAPGKAAPTSPSVKEETQPIKQVDKPASGGSVTAQAAPGKAAPASPQVKDEPQPVKQVDKPSSGDSVTAQAAPAKAAPASPQVKEETQAIKKVEEPASGGSVTAPTPTLTPTKPHVAVPAVTHAAEPSPPPAAQASTPAPASPAAVVDPDLGASISQATPSAPALASNRPAPIASNGDGMPSTNTGRVQEMMRLLSPQSSSVSRVMPAEKVPKASEEQGPKAPKASEEQGPPPPSKTPATTPMLVTQSSSMRRTTGSIPFVVSSHDKQNTVNAFQLLKLGAFKMQPLVDFVEYSELMKLRLEDGIDPTRREDYLNGEEFVKVFGMDREAFKALPTWKKVQKKKEVSLF